MSTLGSRIVGHSENPCIAFLHGFMGQGEDFSQLADELQDRFRAILVDLPGHGASRHRGASEITMESAACDVVETLDDLGVGRCGLAGYSMGGRLALLLALTQPDRFSRLALVSASPGIASESERNERHRADRTLATRLEIEPYEQFLAAWYRQPLFASLLEHPDAFEAMLARRRTNDTAALARALRGLGPGSQEPLWNRLGELRIPTIAIVGERDSRYVDIAHRMTAASGRIRAEVVRGAGHAVHEERPEAFAALLADFFSGDQMSSGQEPAATGSRRSAQPPNSP